MSLSPGSYELQASKTDFRPLAVQSLHVHVTETLRLELHLELVIDGLQLFVDALMLQLDTSALGRVADEEAVSGLPLVTRNFTQIAGLSTGVSAEVFNCGRTWTAWGGALPDYQI